MKKIFLPGIILILISAVWFFLIRQDLPQPILYRRTWTDHAIAFSSGKEDFSAILQEMIDKGESKLKIEVNGYRLSLSELGNAISYAFQNSSDYYLKNSANYWEYYIHENSGGSRKVKIRIYYQETRKERDYVKKKAEKIAWNIIEPDMTDLERIRTVYEWVIRNITYDQFYARHGGYHALKGKAVCQGYALLLYRMLEGLGFKNIIVSGGNHMWNMVELEGNWYHLDATYDDLQEGIIMKKHHLNYANFLKSDSDMEKTEHKWDQGTYPRAPRSFGVVE